MWRLVTRHFGWKLGSVLMAVLLWIAIDGEPELVTTHPVPILYKNLPRDLLIGSDAIDQVRVELRGPSGRLTASSLSDLAAVLDLSSIEGPEKRTFTFAESDFHLPAGVIFLRAVPSQLQLQFGRRKSRDVPVEVRFSTAPPEGYAIAGQQVTPAQIRIAGPERRVDAIASAQTDPISLSGVTQRTEIRVNTFVADPQVWLESPPMVTVIVTIEKRGKTN
jgi:YbbR domain-containing protein